MSLMKPKLPVGGLALGPNDLDSPPGNFQVAENVVHRREGILEPMPGDQEVGEGWVLPEQIARIFSDWSMDYSLRITKAVGTSAGKLSYGTAVPTEYAETEFAAGRTQCVYADGRHILSGAQFNVVLDGDTDSTHGDPRRAGMAPPHYVDIFQNVSTAGDQRVPTLAANKVCAYTAVLMREITGERRIVSAPCAKTRTGIYPADATYIDLFVYFQSQITTADGTTDLVVAGDVVEIYRTKAADSVAELNDTYYLVGAAPLESVDITSELVYFEDRTPDDALGAELYVNPGAQGSLKTHTPIPESSCVETFGLTTFYTNYRTAPIATFTIPNDWGALPLATSDTSRRSRASGIGSRLFLGATTNGSPDITGLSADDLVGIAIGQLVYHANLPGGFATIIAIGGTSITLDENFTATHASTSIESVDAMQILSTDSSGAVTFSEWFRISHPRLMLTGLRDLEEFGTGNPMHGFSAVLDRVYVANPVPNSIAVSGATVNVFATQPDACRGFAILVTNAQNYSSLTFDSGTAWNRAIRSTVDVRSNVVWYSKPNQPEHVAPIQFFLVGSGTVYRLLNVQSCMLAFCSDGIYKIDGQGDQWFITLVDNAARLLHPDCAVANTTVAFAWLESGLSLCTETGTQNISKDAIGPDLQPFVKTFYARTDGPQHIWGPQLAIDRLNSEVYLLASYFPNEDDPVFLKCYVFNTLTAKFTTCGEQYTAMCYAPSELCVLRSKDGFLYVDSSIATDYKIATVVYLPLVDDAGIVKQWNDVNYFFDNVPEGASDTYDVEALFGGELTSTTNVFEKDQTGAPTNMFALHCLVPRRAARGVELILGFRTSTEVSETHPSGGYYFQFKGVSVRARVASQVIKR